MNKKYDFAPATLAALEPFRAYLKQEQFSTSYIRQTINYTATFYEWMTGQSLALAQVTHADVMEFADWLRQENYSIRLIIKPCGPYGITSLTCNRNGR